MPENRYRLPKTARVHLRRDIEEIFSQGKLIRAYPVQVMYQLSQDSSVSLKMAVTVPKKLFKLAVHRNRIKRQMREAYRKNSMELKNLILKKKLSLKLMFIFTGKELPAYDLLESKIILILRRLGEENELGVI